LLSDEDVEYVCMCLKEILNMI
jgi:hypothetical protein